MNRLTAIPGALALLIFAGGEVRAEMTVRSVVIPCGTTAEIVARLSDEFGEAIAAEGSAGPGNSLRMGVYVNRESRSWTVVLHTPDGTTCIVADGLDFESVPFVAKPGKGA